MQWNIKYKAAIVSSLIAFMSACSSKSIGKDSIDVALKINITQPEPKSLRVRGETNLPNDFIVEIFVCRYLVAPEHAETDKLVSGTCGGGTYIDIKKVRVKDQNFIASFQIPTVSETQQIQSQYLQDNPQRTDIQDKVPWRYIDVQVSGFPSQQKEKIRQQIGAQGMNLAGSNVILKPPSKNREAYKMIRWNTKVKM